MVVVRIRVGHIPTAHLQGKNVVRRVGGDKYVLLHLGTNRHHSVLAPLIYLGREKISLRSVETGPKAGGL
jgi:hypothetical protein